MAVDVERIFGAERERLTQLVPLWEPEVHPPASLQLRSEFVERYRLDEIAPELVEFMNYCSGITDFTPGINLYCCPDSARQHTLDAYMSVLERYAFHGADISMWDSPVSTWIPLLVPQDAEDTTDDASTFLLTAGGYRGRLFFLDEDVLLGTFPELLEEYLQPVQRYLDRGEFSGWFNPILCD